MYDNVPQKVSYIDINCRKSIHHCYVKMHIFPSQLNEEMKENVCCLPLVTMITGVC